MHVVSFPWLHCKTPPASSNKMPLVIRAKCVLVGDSTVGKTALTQSFLCDGTQFAKSYNMTTGVEVCMKPVSIPGTDVTVELFIHDSAGKEVFSDYVQQFWDHPNLLMVVYNVTDEQSLRSCTKWIERVKAQKVTPELQLPGVLVANKVDLVERRVVSEDEGRKLASSKELEYFECSAKEPKDVAKPFLYLAKQFYQLHEWNLEQTKSMT